MMPYENASFDNALLCGEDKLHVRLCMQYNPGGGNSEIGIGVKKLTKTASKEVNST